ncbi:MAG: hypothetical protein LQ338_000705 [Usnochroma carphineum]|nr:MAG: hypothetical protein LQ338_000705 [Usnochroma carphineum]
MVDDIDVDPRIHPWVRYTVKNIYAINNFFQTYYIALYNAAGVVGNNIEKMIQVVDVIVQPSMTLQYILLALAVGLAFLGAPSFALQTLNIETGWLKGAVQTLVISTQQTPNVGRALWPAGTDHSQVIQTAELHMQLSNITTSMSGMMDGGVKLIMTDINTFVNYAGEKGRYSGPNVTNTGEGTGLTVPQSTDAVAYALKTYLLSYSMWQNKWYATFDVGPYMSKDEVAQAKSCQWDDDNGVCVGYEMATYWSPGTLRIYSLACEGPKGALSPVDMIKTINKNAWAPLDVLFDGGFNCTAENRAGGSSVNFNYDGSLDLACVSQLPMYIQCGTMCPTALVNGSCLFGDIGVIKKGACDGWQGWY